MGAGADTWRLRVLDMDDHLTGGGLVGERAPRLELQDMLAQAHLTLQLLGPLGARLHIPGQKCTFLVFTIYFKDTNGKRWAIELFFSAFAILARNQTGSATTLSDLKF